MKFAILLGKVIKILKENIKIERNSCENMESNTKFERKSK
jgi:hypothetical protein